MSFFRSQKSQEHDDYARDSLSSLALSKRLQNWSASRNLKTKPFSLDFHIEWRHSSCKVTEWYSLIAPSTRFTSIEHRKTLEAPFFHEFLLIYFIDGSTCRLERMGDGSRADALRFVGCTAHDIIQWFPAGDYATSSLFQERSELILRVEFPRQFDLLDVLAICWAMRQHRRAFGYTLQRYNCYFLCSTILVILTRCVGGWEEKVAPMAWPKLVEDVLKELPLMKHQDAFDYFGIGVCSLLRPDHPTIITSVVDLLRSELNSTTRGSLTPGIADALWHTDMQSTIEAPLMRAVDSVVQHISTSDAPDAKALNALLSDLNIDMYPRVELDDPLVQKKLVRSYISANIRTEKRALEAVYKSYKMRQSEAGSGPSPTIDLLASIIGPAFVLLTHTGQDFIQDNIIPPLSIETEILTSGYTRASVARQLGKYLTLDSWDDAFHAALVDDEAENSDADDVNTRLLMDLHRLHKLPIVNTRNKALSLLNHDLDHEKWAYSLKFCLDRLVSEAMPSPTPSGRIKVFKPKKTFWTTHDMQNFIWQRIRDHAKRIEGYNLGVARDVEADLEKTMTEIWRKLPYRFGGEMVEC